MNVEQFLALRALPELQDATKEQLKNKVISFQVTGYVSLTKGLKFFRYYWNESSKTWNKEQAPDPELKHIFYGEHKVTPEPHSDYTQVYMPYEDAFAVSKKTYKLDGVVITTKEIDAKVFKASGSGSTLYDLAREIRK